jgi:hypothetical protein
LVGSDMNEKLKCASPCMLMVSYNSSTDVKRHYSNPSTPLPFCLTTNKYYTSALITGRIIF